MKPLDSKYNLFGMPFDSSNKPSEYYKTMFPRMSASRSTVPIVMNTPKRSTVPHATVLEETSELPKVWSQQKFIDTNMIF